MPTRYRVVSKREGSRPKVRTFASLAAARKRVALLTSPEPWTVLGLEANDYMCCSGTCCGCGGMTQAEETERMRREMPPLEYVRIDEREVSPWRTLDDSARGGGAR